MSCTDLDVSPYNRVLVIASPAALPGGPASGETMVIAAITEEFLKRGCAVGYVGLVKPAKWGEPKFPDNVSGWASIRARDYRDGQFVAEAIAAFNPDLLFCYSAEAATLARFADPRGQIVAVFHGWAGWGKRWQEFRHGSIRTKASAIRRIPETWRLIRQRPDYAAADRVISFPAWGAKYGYHYVPLPLPMVPRNPRNRPTERRECASFLLVGGLASKETQAGLRFFAARVLPKVKDLLRAGEIEIKIIGRGTLPPDLQAKLDYPGISILGFISDEQLMDEYAECLAVLVPSPIGESFSTRIMDAFRRGIPVIAHKANRRAFAELEHWNNCALAGSGAGFANAMQDAMMRPRYMQEVADRARREFKQNYHVGCFVDALCQ